MDLTITENRLLEAFRRLPDATASEVALLVGRLAELPEGTRVDWSDSWSDEDFEKYRAASSNRIDEDTPHE
jgi:hypothetical protein